MSYWNYWLYSSFKKNRAEKWILDLLKMGGWTLSEIIDETTLVNAPISKQEITKAVKRLVRLGKVEKTSLGEYVLKLPTA